MLDMVQDATPEGKPPPGAPLVSVGLPVHNGERYVEEAVRSVLAQDYPNLELVICDNASDDATEQICRRIAGADPRVRYLRSATNIGLMPNFRKALEESAGKYFTWLAHDDALSDPAYLSTVVSYLERHPDTVACTTAFRLLNSEFGMAGEVIRFPEIAPERWPRSRQEFFRWPHGWIESLTIYGVIRRSALLMVNLPERTYKGRPHIFWWETDVVTALCRLGPIVALPQPLRSYRLAVVTEGTGLATWVSTFDLYRLGLRMKLILIGRACRMPGPLGERLRLIATALANLFRANLGQPYDHAYVSRSWEIAVTALENVARERAEVVENLRRVVLERRKRALAMNLDPGPEPVPSSEVSETGTPAQIAESTSDRYSRGWLADFFLPPSAEQISLGRELRARMGRLNLRCRSLLEEMVLLDAEAARLQQELERASEPAGANTDLGPPADSRPAGTG